MSILPRPRHIRLAICALVLSLEGLIPAWAESTSCQISSTPSGPTVSNGSYEFDALSQRRAVVGSPADFIKLQSSVGGVLSKVDPSANLEALLRQL
jgi:hypothetical protein